MCCASKYCAAMFLKLVPFDVDRSRYVRGAFIVLLRVMGGVYVVPFAKRGEILLEILFDLVGAEGRNFCCGGGGSGGGTLGSAPGFSTLGGAAGDVIPGGDDGSGVDCGF